MKKEMVYESPEHSCVMCSNMTSTPYGRTTYGDTLCTRKCCQAWYRLSLEARFKLHNERTHK